MVRHRSERRDRRQLRCPRALHAEAGGLGPEAVGLEVGPVLQAARVTGLAAGGPGVVQRVREQEVERVRKSQQRAQRGESVLGLRRAGQALHLEARCPQTGEARVEGRDESLLVHGLGLVGVGPRGGYGRVEGLDAACSELGVPVRARDEEDRGPGGAARHCRLGVRRPLGRAVAVQPFGNEDRLLQHRGAGPPAVGVGIVERLDVEVPGLEVVLAQLEREDADRVRGAHAAEVERDAGQERSGRLLRHAARGVGHGALRQERRVGLEGPLHGVAHRQLQRVAARPELGHHQ